MVKFYFTISLNDDISTLNSSFQNGCNTIVSGCTTYGSTPSSNSPADIVNAIKNIYNNRYNSGYSNGKTDGASGMYTKAQYDANYDTGYNKGTNDGYIRGHDDGAISIRYSGTLNSSGNATELMFKPQMGIACGAGSYTYIFVAKVSSTGTFPSKGYLSYRYSLSTLWENDSSFSGFGYGYANWNRATLAGKPFIVCA